MAEVRTTDDVQDFLNSSTFGDDIENLNKDALLVISNYLDLGLTIHTRKSEMIRQIVKRTKSEESPVPKCNVESLKLEIKLRELALEEIKIERAFEQQEKEKQREFEQQLQFRKMQEREKEMQEREKERQHELRLAELQGRGGNTPPSDQFDVTKFFRVVPKFNESDVPKFFLSFEKIA